MYFIAGVANADLFSGDQLFSHAKTLIESSITIGVSAEDVRAGQGAKLYGKFFHSSTFDMTMTDQMFKIDYIAKNIGSTISIGGDALTTESVTLTAGGAGTVVGTPASFGSFGTIGWVAAPGTDTWTKVTFSTQAFTVSGGSEGETYCVKYASTNAAAKKLVVSANIIPNIIHVILTANLYDGDPASDLGASTKVGTVTIDIPRFMLNGAQELSMSMTGVSQTDISGSALAATSGTASCADDDYYATIVETIPGNNWYDDAIGLSVEDADFTIAALGTKTLKVYAIYANAVPKLVTNTDLTFVSTTTATATVSSAGVVTGVASGTTTIRIKITAKPAIECAAFVTVS